MDERDFQAPRGETFDVVLMKNGVSAFSCTEDDFKRVNVHTTEGAYGARSLPEVEAVVKDGFNVYAVVTPGLRTEGERLARERAHEATYGSFDRSKV